MSNGIWLFRHGILEPNPERRFVGQREVALTSAGRLQYEQLATDFVSEVGTKVPTAIFCSDLARCLECAEILRRAFRPHAGSMPVLPDPGFREISLGAWEGLTKAEVEKRYPGALDERAADYADYAPAGGESFAMVQRRALVALLRARLKYPEGMLVVVGHAGVNRTILADYLALPLENVLRIPQGYACRAFLENR